MSIKPIVTHFTSRHWRSRLLLIICLLTGSLLAMGAKDVTDELLLRPVFRSQLEQSLAAWNEMIVMELPTSQRLRWQKVLSRNPELLMDACALQNLKPLTPR